MCKYVILWMGLVRTPGVDYKLVGNCEATGAPRIEPAVKIPKGEVVTAFVIERGLWTRRLDLQLKESARANTPLSFVDATSDKLA
jgi:hypothetical protein